MNSPTAQPDRSLHRILVVDDEEIVLVALRETLRREGYQVDTTVDALQALELVRQEQYAVIITDQMMPLLSGLEFLGQVKQLQPDATRILITAVLSLSTVIDAINKGEIYRFIVKPWLREELLATIRNAVQRYELILRNTVLQATTLSMNEQLKHLNRSLEEQVARVAAQARSRCAMASSTFRVANWCRPFIRLALSSSLDIALRAMPTMQKLSGNRSLAARL